MKRTGAVEEKRSLQEKGPLREILVKPRHLIIGHVKDGYIHVANIVHDGISEVALTGQRPDLMPIPVEEIEAIRKQNGLPDPIEPSPIDADKIKVVQE